VEAHIPIPKYERESIRYWLEFYESPFPEWTSHDQWALDQWEISTPPPSERWNSRT